VILFHQNLTIVPDFIAFELVLHELVASFSIVKHEFLLFDVIRLLKLTPICDLHRLLKVRIHNRKVYFLSVIDLRNRIHWLKYLVPSQ